MTRMTSRGGLAALGMGMALAMSAGIYASSAQTGPRVLPSSPEYQDRAPDQDRQFDRGFGPTDRGDRFARPEDRLERRLAFLHTQLRITPAQERGWQAFAAVLRDEARDRTRENGFDRRDRSGAASVVERLENRQQRLAERNADLDRVLRTLRPLYSSFSAEQKRTADRLMFQPGGGRGFGTGGVGGFGRGGAPGRFDRDDRRDGDYRSNDNRDNPQDRDYRPGDYRY